MERNRDNDDLADGTARPTEFHIEEYRGIQQKLETRAKENNDVARFTLVGAAAIAAWVLTHEMDPATSQVSWTLPLALCVFGWLRSIGIGIQTDAAAEYLRGMECEYASKKLQGYERRLEAAIKDQKARNWLVRLLDVNWAYLLASGASAWAAVSFGQIHWALAFGPVLVPLGYFGWRSVQGSQEASTKK